MKIFLSFVLTLVFFFVVLHVNNANETETNEMIDFKQKNLSAMIEISGGFKGKILLIDFPGSGHERCMSFAITQLVPNQNFITAGEALPETPKTLEERDVYRERKMREHSVRIMHIPGNYIASAATILKEHDLQVLKNTDVLAVYATGNFDSYPHTDIYHPGDPYWGHLEEGDFLRERSSAVTFEEVEAHFQAGHAVIATYAIKKPDTFEEFVNSIFSQKYIEDIGGTEALKKMYQSADKYIRHPYIVRFGGLKEYGFTILLTGNHTTCSKGGRWISPSSSFASAHLSAFAFYLFQLWDTTAEVVEVMQKTAIDIGEPGPDEEFGWGLINADHPIIWNRSIEKLQESLSFCLLEDIALEDAVTAIANEGFNLFYDVNSTKREIGLTYGKDNTALALTTGVTSGPFGLSSRFLQRQQGSFIQCGLRYSFANNMSLVSVFGHSEQEDIKINKGSIGVGYRKDLSEKGDFSLYAGYRTIRGTLGLLGYDVVSARKVPFALHIPELRTSFNWTF